MSILSASLLLPLPPPLCPPPALKYSIPSTGTGENKWMPLSTLGHECAQTTLQGPAVDRRRNAPLRYIPAFQFFPPTLPLSSSLRRVFTTIAGVHLDAPPTSTPHSFNRVFKLSASEIRHSVDLSLQLPIRHYFILWSTTPQLAGNRYVVSRHFPKVSLHHLMDCFCRSPDFDTLPRAISGELSHRPATPKVARNLTYVHEVATTGFRYVVSARVWSQTPPQIVPFRCQIQSSELIAVTGFRYVVSARVRSGTHQSPSLLVAELNSRDEILSSHLRRNSEFPSVLLPRPAITVSGTLAVTTLTAASSSSPPSGSTEIEILASSLLPHHSCPAKTLRRVHPFVTSLQNSQLHLRSSPAPAEQCSTSLTRFSPQPPPEATKLPSRYRIESPEYRERLRNAVTFGSASMITPRPHPSTSPASFEFLSLVQSHWPLFSVLD
ncbi:hypothetical protein DFP72DRAFT_1051147 [Ephemerocybe angulata]|uniref:Uncharacterized protein n=1 Tax=Ephemerocybe angulata TaxID=980116 RepID=A0A8H6HES6_9AGAR|nr:hypothetical protein DFP72DRAFT_1051147 [Tulosesus angulatus]